MPQVSVIDVLAYVQNWKPEVFSLGPLTVHWYGMAYLCGFLAAIALLRWFSKRDLLQLNQTQCMDFIVLCALFGVMLGGRLGYVFFYDPKLLGFREDFPWWSVLAVWDGGMASHGGILGVIAVTFWYGWKHKISPIHIGDNLVVAAPLGLAFGRFANFINGELYGKPAENLPWAVKFPKALLHEGTKADASLESKSRLASVLSEANATGFPPQSQEALLDSRVYYQELLIAERSAEAPQLSEIFSNHLIERHPSQLYEMFAEGILLFLILFGVRLMGGKKLPVGLLTGLFFILYALGRIISEFYRVPDASLILGMSRGQFFSLFLIGIGVAFLHYAWRKGKPTPATKAKSKKARASKAGK